MRQRGPTEQQQAKQPSPAAAAAARAAASKRPSTRRSRARGFWIATGCFLFCLVVYVCFSSGGGSGFTASTTTRSRSAKSGPRVAERDVVALRLATQQVVAATTLPNFEELSRTAAPIGAAYLSLLEEVAAAEELEDGGHALRQLDVSQHYLTSVGTALRAAADVAYTKLQRMLLRLPNAELALAPTSLVRTMYGWILSDLFLYGAVLPEYYLLQDDTPSHAAVLLRAVNLLSWTPLVHTVPSAQPDNAPVGGAETMYDIFNWSGGGNTACRKGPVGAVSKAWLRFCESSFISAATAARRAAATWEELIVLFPDYAPLRLHYAVSFTFLAPSSVDASGALSEHAMKVLRVIRNDREKLGVRYKHADAVHAPLLVLLEAYLTPVDLWTANQETDLVQALTDLEDCAHVRASLLSASEWHGGVLAGEYRMPLLNAEELRSLLSKARVHLGADHVALSSFTECM